MKPIFDVIVLMGGLMFVASIFCANPNTPVVSWSPKDWRPGKWKGKEHLFFRGPGRALCRVGAAFMGTGSVGWMIIWLIR